MGGPAGDVRGKRIRHHVGQRNVSQLAALGRGEHHLWANQLDLSHDVHHSRPAAGRGLSVTGASAGKRIYPLVTELAGDGVPVAVACRVLKLARQPYYRWLGQPMSDAMREEAYRANALFDAHRDDPEFGYRFLADEARGAGAVMADRTAWRICRDNRW
jgi:hypothetical protein